MSLYALVVVFVLSGQLVGQDRYGNPVSGETAADRSDDFGGDDSSSFGSGLQGVAPPEVKAGDPYSVPPSARPGTGRREPLGNDGRGVRNAPSTPPRSATATAEDYGLGNRSDEDGAGVKPSTLMRAMLSAPDGARLSGQPISLDEAVAGATSRSDQTQRIAAYWDLCSSVADYYLGLREHEELRRLKALVTTSEPAWQQAEAELGIRIGTSQRAAVASQYRLANLIGRGDDVSLPLPANLPHCGDYYTRFDQVFAGRESNESVQLSELLPLRYEELKDASSAVGRAEQWLDAVATQRSAATDGTGMLRALELLALRRRAFVQIVRDYNHRIARYSELAAPGPIDSDRLIGMLIKRDDVASTATRSSATAAPPNRQTQSEPATPPATFTEGWSPVDERRQSSAERDEAVRPASGEMEQTRRREHSLLVPSK